MNKSIWWMLLPVTVTLAVFGVFFVLYPERMLAEGTLLAAVLIAACSVGVLIYSPMLTNASAKAQDIPSRPGVASIVSGILVLVAFSGVVVAIGRYAKASMALDIVTVAGFVAMFIVLRAMNSGNAAAKGPVQSANIVWADRLEGIARGCGMPQLRPKLLKLAGETRLLTGDNGTAPVEMNQRISGLIDTIADMARQGDEQGAVFQLKRLRNLFSERESEILHLRSRG
ncbi:MAG: hypothetical protein LWW75_09885 [Chlorobiales bacterium]|nr:hypothetical protein [Chlorobiales bacterium]